MTLPRLITLCLSFLGACTSPVLAEALIQTTLGQNPDPTLWYSAPAHNAMNEALPLGNGRMGGLVFGTTAQEHVVLNEDSLWTGDENPTGDYDKMGAYQKLADLYINLPGHDNVTDYRRDLDIAHALAHVTYKIDGITYQREFLCSHPGEVFAIRFTADKPGSYNGSISLVDAHGAKAIYLRPEASETANLTITGGLPNDLKYATRLVVLHEGGSISTLTSSDGNDAVNFTKCDALTLLVGTGTNYTMDENMDYRGGDPDTKVAKQIFQASQLGYEALKTGHVQDYQTLFNRVALNLGQSTSAQQALPTDERKQQASKTFDPGMEQMLFQYGRYLMISCSRNSLPANLQGLWNDSNKPEWSSDYHTDINVQMCYWPAEPDDLSDCAMPLFDLIESQVGHWRKTTASSQDLKTPSGELSSRGWALRCSHNIFGGMGWDWDKTANAWYCLHYWEHYAFTQDKDFLRKRAYPLLKETTQFWEDHLKKDEDGHLVVPNGWSPEHGPHEDGVSYNQEIVWSLFNNYVRAADVLDIDKDYRDKVAAMGDQLLLPRIGKWGQLQEWREDTDDPNDDHRHTSHLFAVYPGDQISPATTPQLATAAEISLEHRSLTGDVREWSFAWRTALWARFRNGEQAHEMIRHFLEPRNSCPNLFGLHPPMQIDGDFGIAAGTSEILLQSQNRTSDNRYELDLLPALPAAWNTGSVQGLRARGGFTVGMKWDNGKLNEAVIHSLGGTTCQVRYGVSIYNIQMASGESRKLTIQ